MGWLERIWRGRQRGIEARAQISKLIEEDRIAEAFVAVSRALAADPEADDLLHTAAAVLRRDGQAQTAELFDRAADSPADPQRFFELGTHLLNRDSPELAAT